ncbi:HdeD family acid-resistance protein [Legionella sp. CNM-4043-24]|uniref:HdeD family acid-resistance protein n=1 Tax=Legionella sp. CNM-4043-24 TaxID=3421646 RepID=UPI00403B0C11
MENTKIEMELAPANLKRSWTWLLGLGILFVILGGIGMGMVVGLTLVSVMFLGVLLVIAGVSQLFDLSQCKEWKAMIWHALIALLYIVAGGLVIYDPILASTMITAMIAWVLIIIGVARLMMAFSLRHVGGWFWLLLAGLTAIVLGIIILAHWPWSGLWVIGLFIAIELLVDGWTYIFLAFAMRNK